MNSNQQPSAAKPAKENEEMVSAQVNDHTERIKNTEEKNGRLIGKNMGLQEQQSIVASAPTIGSCDGEPDITRLSIRKSYQELKDENDSLKKKCEKLIKFNSVLTDENIELKIKLEDYRSQDSEDGKKTVSAEHENSMNQSQPWQMLGFNNPFNCAVSCVLSVVSFIFFRMGLRICNRKLNVGVHCELSKVKEANEVCDVGKCSLTLENFYNVGLIEDKSVFSKEIKDGDNILCVFEEVTETVKSAKHAFPALLVMHYKVENSAGHCVAIMPDGDIIDVQRKKCFEPAKDKRIALVNRIYVWKVDQKEAKEWEKMCHLNKCRGEGGQCIPKNEECSNDMLE